MGSGSDGCVARGCDINVMTEIVSYLLFIYGSALYMWSSSMVSAIQKHQFTMVVVVSQAVFMVLFGLFAKYDVNTMPGGSEDAVPMASKYPMFQDTHVMIFIGFGFLMTFLKRYGFSAISMNMLLSCFTIEWSMIVRGLLSHEFAHEGKFSIGLEQLLTADFAAAVVLISMGAMLGKLSPVQYLIMTLIETPLAILAEHHVVHTFHVNDVGGSIIVHAFGAYFGLACSRAFANSAQRNHEHEGSIYHSDIYAMIGALFLWVFWPSFNGAVAEPADARQRAVCNTLLSLCACTITTFLISQATDHHKRFDMVHIANSTLAGGVAIGTIANVILHPLHAMVVGVIAGLISVIGFRYITPLLANKLGVHDTCGVNNLHGMPGVLAGLLSSVFVITYDPVSYGKRWERRLSGATCVELPLSTSSKSRHAASPTRPSPSPEVSYCLNSIYPAMKSESNAEGISAYSQAINQLIGLSLVLVSSLVSGLVTGFLLRLKLFNQVREKELYADGDYFETPGDYDFTSRIISRIDRVEINEHTQLTQKEA